MQSKEIRRAMCECVRERHRKSVCEIYEEKKREIEREKDKGKEKERERKREKEKERQREREAEREREREIGARNEGAPFDRESDVSKRLHLLALRCG